MTYKPINAAFVKLFFSHKKMVSWHICKQETELVFLWKFKDLILKHSLVREKKKKSQLSTWIETRWHGLMIRPLQRGKNLEKNTTKLLTVFLRAIREWGGHSKPSKECVVMTWRLLVRSRAVVWQSDLWDKFLKISFGITQKQIPFTTIWQKQEESSKKICRHQKLKPHGNKRLYQHQHAISLWINKISNVNLNFTFKPAAMLPRMTCATSPSRKNPTEQQLGEASSHFHCPPIASLHSD